MPAAAGGQAYALRAGTELNCTGGEATLTNIQAAINAGLLSEGVIDNALTQLFTMRMETGEFDPAEQGRLHADHQERDPEPGPPGAGREGRRRTTWSCSRTTTSTGHQPPLLPADPAKLNNVVIVGNLANTVTLGGYSGDPTLQVNAVQGITAAVKAANPSATVTFDSCGTSTTATAAAAARPRRRPRSRPPTWSSCSSAPT